MGFAGAGATDEDRIALGIQEGSGRTALKEEVRVCVLIPQARLRFILGSHRPICVFRRSRAPEGQYRAMTIRAFPVGIESERFPTPAA